MVVVDERIVVFIIFVAELDGGDLQYRTLGHAEALREAARRHIADDDLERHDLHLFHKRLALAQLLDKMRGHAFFSQQLHQVVRKAVVHNALAPDGALLRTVARGGVILVIDDHQLRVVRRVYFLCLALIELFPFFHNPYSFLLSDLIELIEWMERIENRPLNAHSVFGSND